MIFIPSRTLVLVLIGVGAVLATLSGVDAPHSTILQAAAASGAVLVFLLVIDGYLSLSAWKRAPLTLKRHLPRAFAVGAPVTVGLSLENGDARRHSGRLFDMADASMDTPSMPLTFALEAGQRQTLQFKITPTLRGLKRFDPAQIRLRSNFGLLDLNLQVGGSDSRRVFPNFELHAAFEIGRASCRERV